MTKQEFIERTGIAVSDDQYLKIEGIYMNAGAMDKNQFCEDYKKHADSEIIKTLSDQVDVLESTASALNKQRDEMIDFLIIQTEKWSATDLRTKVISMIGIEKFIAKKLEMGFNLWEMDKEDLINILNK